MKQVLIIGGGAAGMMAAVSAARQGAGVVLLEKMPALGRKILITGKGRCNITNDCDTPTMIRNMPGNGPFLYSALNAFTNRDIVELLENQGVPTKTERGGRVFPVSDSARDVVAALEKALRAAGVEIHTGEPVKELLIAGGVARGAVTAKGRTYEADAVVVCTGGASYPGTGSSGDGYRMAAEAGHRIIPLKPSLVPLEVEEEWAKELQGLALKNVTAAVLAGSQKIAEEFGELLFTHFGLSGPIILSLSNAAAKALESKTAGEVLVEINLKPALSAETLDKRLQRDFAKFSRKQFKNALGELLPARLIEVVIDLAHIHPDKAVHQITKEERLRLADTLQRLTLTVTGTRPLSEAIVTAGGVDTREINPSRMESKLIKNLFFAGEVIDFDGYTGGFNLQAAFSTGFVAGKRAAE
ncbi:MAG TPA: NAD(P)/FAD-dependent oxidoreductase [Selenomonadales bacterium]|nr:NAD(P)/FAD-dependent oxidoreductase [Selenomonadales bacterium]